MPRTSQTVQVGRRKIELSNLRKVLYPEDNILKAELIEYYLALAPTILAHLKGRPLSLVRYPDGIDGERFFQKNRPEWAPDWLEHVLLEEAEKKERIDYVMATEEASLVWLANLACIELHQMHCRSPHFDKPDYFVFDLDPPENYGFRDLVAIALAMKEHIENFGYRPFVKTTGRKGLHIIVPIEPQWTFDRVFDAALELAKLFVESHSQSTTLQIRKEARKGRVLIDVYRNRSHQTIVSAYSLRGLPGAPVSMPLRWDQLEGLSSVADFKLRDLPAYLTRNGDAWEGIAAYAAELHTVRKRIPARKEAVPSGKLAEYAGKRSFGKTPEPLLAMATGEGDSFVLHRHHATRLHYDLRLEQGGVLKSWAIPKGLPPRPGIIRLAVSTEDHPLEYMNFEGTIPKGQYGGGEIWIYARGKYEITEEKKKGFHFRLQSSGISAEYRMHPAREKEWIIERVDRPQVDWLRDPIGPMLAQSAVEPPDSEKYIYEVKWDGIRAMIALDEGEIRIHSRNRQDITGKFPELLIPDQAFRASSALFDAEIVCLDDAGRPVFTNVIHRIQQTGKGAIERAGARHPAVCYVFDCLYLDGRPIVNEPLVRRRSWMEDAIRRDTPYRVSEAVTEGRELFDAAVKMGLEGIMAKERNSVYRPGARSAQWLKIKKRQTMDCVIIGYTKRKDDPEASFGALQLALREDNSLRYLGKVGTGFDVRLMKEIFGQLKKIKGITRPIKEKPPDDAQTVWIEPKIICEVQFASITRDGMLREPVFLRLRPDLTA
ncbi:MAG: non-homologous end-joining DNA ligase [Thermodesulfovibrionales bacterium]|jgi:DNA ligase D-like protein (predicted ligase)/DNA ligase D-like protein (predicted polymerase)/DNA ligase D-like protein (predicted 3'-phosphoesterase)